MLLRRLESGVDSSASVSRHGDTTRDRELVWRRRRRRRRFNGWRRRRARRARRPNVALDPAVGCGVVGDPGIDARGGAGAAKAPRRETSQKPLARSVWVRGDKRTARVALACVDVVRVVAVPNARLRGRPADHGRTVNVTGAKRGLTISVQKNRLTSLFQNPWRGAARRERPQSNDGCKSTLRPSGRKVGEELGLPSAIPRNCRVARRHALGQLEDCNVISVGAADVTWMSCNRLDETDNAAINEHTAGVRVEVVGADHHSDRGSSISNNTVRRCHHDIAADKAGSTEVEPPRGLHRNEPRPGIGIGVVPVDNPAMTVESWVKRKSACESTTENYRGDEKSGKHTVGSVWRVREGWGRWDPGIGYWVQC
eukprot:m.304209 g.304209  ORF g.304209 m.304209 type:complete len:369 (+) comp27315_c1_seq6:1265-2371(+)